MHAVISNWRLKAGEDVDAIAAAIADRLTSGGEDRLPGHLAGWAIDAGDGRMSLFNAYADDGDAQATADAILLVVLNVLDGRAELIDRYAGPASDLVAL